jgi:hypothetical protein
LEVSKTKSSVTLTSLTEDQRDLIKSMTAAASSSKGHAAHVRAAAFDSESLSSSHEPWILPTIFASEPGCAWKVVTSADIQAGALDNFDVIVFPGGSGKQQAAALGDKGMRAVQEFVREGGGYVGVCAGGFLATCKPNGSLGIVNAKASCSNAGGWVKMELTDVGTSVLGEFPGLLAASYGGGPIFFPAGERDLPEYVPLAFYRTEVATYKAQKRTLTDTPAIIAARFGKGRVLLFSVHPEGIKELEPLVKRAIFSVARAEKAK